MSVAFKILLILVLAAPEPTLSTNLQGFRLTTGDTICLMGSALAERMQHHGWLETRLQCRLPQSALRVRNLGFASDELTVQQRTSGFGTWQQWLERSESDVVLAFFGNMESFRGTQHLPQFRLDLAEYIAQLGALRTAAGAPVRLVLCSPIPVEDTRDPLLPDAAEANQRLLPFVQAMAEVAAQHETPFVDLFTPMQAIFDAAASQASSAARWTGQALAPGKRALGDASASDLTLNGTHLTELGNQRLAEILEAALIPLGEQADAHEGLVRLLAPRRLATVRQRVLDKNLLWFNRYRATDGYNVYGGRSTLSYVDGVTNREVLQRELDVLHASANALDEQIHALARGETEPVIAEAAIPELMPVVTNRPGPGEDGAHLFRTGEEALDAMTLHDGFAANLFADEQMFPALANPVQMAWDASDRLWVATWPTYPHWVPGQPMNDALMVLEDTDGDGRADSATPFADDLHNPTGFEFFNGGVLVANPPDLLFLKDTDGDGRADLRQRVLHGLGSADTHHSANSFVFGPDGAFYFQEGVFHQSQVESAWGPVRSRDACVWRFDPRTWQVERFIPYGFANPHGHVFDRWGQNFVTDGTGNQNYWALPMSGWLPEPLKKPGIDTFFAQRSRPAAATEILSSRHFPEALQGNYLVANVIGFQGIFQYQMKDQGSGFGATEVEPIVHSSDPNFRPVDIEVGPDGALYVLDWQAPLIGHMQHHLRDPSRDHTHGRIYRYSARGQPVSEAPTIAGATVPELVQLLTHSVDRVRAKVRSELSGRDRDEVLKASREAARKLGDGRPSSDAEHEHHLLELLWLTQQQGATDGALLDRMLNSAAPEARAAATRVARQSQRSMGPLSARLFPQLSEGADIATLSDLLSEVPARVQAEMLVGLSFEPSRTAALCALQFLEHLGDDRFMDYAFRETMRALEPHWRAPLARGERLPGLSERGLAWALGQMDTAELEGAAPSLVLDGVLLSRHGLPPATYGAALRRLSAHSGQALAQEFLAAVLKADSRDVGHVDHLLSGLFASLGSLSPDELAAFEAPLKTLSQDARRTSTRRLAMAARLEQQANPNAAWLEASSSFRGMIDLLEALPLVDDIPAKEALFERVASLMTALPAALTKSMNPGAETPGSESASALLKGRYVRVQLPGPERTLTLAEVQVWSGGLNVALGGNAEQSSTNWGGLAAFGIDGETSGAWGDGAQTHTIENRPDPWWELDLGSERSMDAVELWNRTDGNLGTRLDGYRLTILDGARRPVFEALDQPQPRPSTRHELAPLDVGLQRAAARCLAALGVRRSAAVSLLLGHWGSATLQPALLDALLQIPASEWPAGAVDPLAQRLITELAAAWTTGHAAADPRLLALADAIAPNVSGDLAGPLHVAARRLGPTRIILRPVPDALLFDRTQFTVVAGRSVELHFENTDIMPHNVVVTVPGALAEVGLAAEDMAAEPTAWERSFVPDRAEVLFASRLLQPGESQTLAFQAPETPGDYPYVCTFPGHWVRMNGTMQVVDESEEERLLLGELDEVAHGGDDATVDVKAAAQRSYVAFWSVDDFTDQLHGVDQQLPERGRSLFEVASCGLCHVVDNTPSASGGQRPQTGPPLNEVVLRHDRAALLTHILDPSAEILEGYASETFVTTGGGVLSGRVLAEDANQVDVQVDPYKGTVRELPKSEIARRRPSQISTMPEGLLSTFEKDEVLALIAYLESLRDN